MTRPRRAPEVRPSCLGPIEAHPREPCPIGIGRGWSGATPTSGKGLHRTLRNRAAMRVCHPGPVALQRSMTSAGKRSEINFRGFSDRGRPPFLIFARASISSVNSGNSLYSSALTTWASTRARSDFKERRDAFFLSVIGLPHAEDVTVRAARRVAHNDKASRQQPVTDDAPLAVSSSWCLRSLLTPAKISAASAQSSPRSASVFARLTGSDVIRTGYCIYNNNAGLAMIAPRAVCDLGSAERNLHRDVPVFGGERLRRSDASVKRPRISRSDGGCSS